MASPSDKSKSDGPARRRTPMRDQVLEDIRRRLITGGIEPGRGLSLRRFAAELGVSAMPVREAVHRLAAEQALELGPTGRIQVPEMTAERFEDIVRARVLLEPEAAKMALPNLGRADLATLRAIDEGIDDSLVSGDVARYMEFNHAFHFAIYRAAKSEVFLALIESIWLQFAPFMRIAYGRIGTANMVDQHKCALAAIAAGDAATLADAIARDILDGMGLIGAARIGDLADAAEKAVHAAGRSN